MQEKDRESANPEVERITSRQRLTLLIVSVAGHGLKHMFNAAFFILLPEIKAGLGLSNTQIGTLSTFRGIAGGLANAPAGFVGDRFAKRRAEILGGTIIVVSFFAVALGSATHFWMAVVAASLLSVAISFWHPSAISSLSREFASRRGFAISLHGTGGSIGETLGPVLVGSLLGVVSWRLVLQGSVIPGLVLGIAIWALLRTIPTAEASGASMRQYIGSVSTLLRNGKLLLVLIFAAGFAGGQSTILTFLPIYLDEDLGASSVTIGLYLSLAQVGGIVSQPLIGLASDRLGRKLILSPSLALLGLSFIGLSIAPSGWMFGMVVLGMGAFLFPLMSILLASAMDLVAVGAQATTVALVFGSAVVVSAFAPAIAGMLADSSGTEAAFMFGAGLVLSASLLSMVTRWQRSATD
jgi:FSR family fosmidomycin resistance protein-like MFS transporter